MKMEWVTVIIIGIISAVILCGVNLIGDNEIYATVPIEDARYKITQSESGKVYYTDNYTQGNSITLEGYYFLQRYSMIPFKERVVFSDNIVIIEAGLVEIEDREKE